MSSTLANAYCLVHDCGIPPLIFRVVLGVVGVAAIYFTIKDWWDKR